MKPFLFAIPLVVLLASCASKPAQRIVPVTPEMSGRVLKRGETASVRHPEVIKAYPVGRYVEPRKRGVMHEAHTLYRVESSPKWNLTRPSGPPTIPTPVATASRPSGNELTVELNRQRQATQAVIQGGQIVSGKLTEMTEALQQNRVLAEQNAAMRKELQDTRQRLESLEDEMRSRLPDASKSAPATDDIPW
ncbi:hypothetical protein GCM10023213_32290 [Prosthecobacter algae]|jgi:hypothetical protein|uniref:Lipoprotein n=1 Tax=Prosthecobacter algae TaxID=1144682 RepID=A0ABP9PB16_9BACT